MYKIALFLHTNGMITLLLVCIFFGINVRLYVHLNKIQVVMEVILPLNLTVVSLRVNLFNQTLFYNINGGKVRQISLKKSKEKNKKHFTKIRIDKLSYVLIVGSNSDCVKGLYISNIVDYVSNILLNVSTKYIETSKFDKFILPDFEYDKSKLIVNIVIKKGLMDIIKNIFAKKQRIKYEVKYAN